MIHTWTVCWKVTGMLQCLLIPWPSPWHFTINMMAASPSPIKRGLLYYYIVISYHSLRLRWSSGSSWVAPLSASFLGYTDQLLRHGICHLLHFCMSRVGSFSGLTGCCGEAFPHCALQLGYMKGSEQKGSCVIINGDTICRFYSTTPTYFYHACNTTSIIRVPPCTAVQNIYVPSSQALGAVVFFLFTGGPRSRFSFYWVCI